MGIFVPASPVREPFRTEGLQVLRRLGFIPEEVPEINSCRGLRAKPTALVLEDLQTLFFDPQIKAIWAARGGYGSNELLPLLSKIRLEPGKVFMASSDACHLLWHLLARENTIVFFGPMAYSGLAEGNFDQNSLMQVLGGNHSELFYPGLVIRPGRFRGRISGGCLSVMVASIGTPYSPPISGQALILEDQNEKPHRLARMIWQLSEAGILRQAGALLLGEFPGCFRCPREKEDFFSDLLEKTRDSSTPIIADLPLGHARKPMTVPLGVEIGLDTDTAAGFRLLERGVKTK